MDNAQANYIQDEEPNQQCDKAFLHLGNHKKILGTCGTKNTVSQTTVLLTDTNSKNYRINFLYTLSF